MRVTKKTEMIKKENWKERRGDGGSPWQIIGY